MLTIPWSAPTQLVTRDGVRTPSQPLRDIVTLVQSMGATGRSRIAYLECGEAFSLGRAEQGTLISGNSLDVLVELLDKS